MVEPVKLTEGQVSKGGQNPPNTSTKRPPPPKGSGGMSATQVVDLQQENDALRKRISQLERLVCQSRYKIEGDEPCVDLMDMDDLECLDSFGTREAAIDAAIKHMEKDAGDD